MAPRAALVFAVILVTAGPVRGQVERPPDEILARTDLQAIVDVQVEREGARLAAALGEPDPLVRARAAFALASVQDAAVVPALLAALDDPDPRVRSDAAFALGQTADSSAAWSLLTALDRESEPAVRAEILQALGKTGDGESLARLAALDVPAGEHAALALAIGRYGLRGIFDPDAVGRLLDLLPRDYGSALDFSRDGEDAEAEANAAWFFARADTSAWSREADRLRAAVDAYFLLDRARPGGAELPARNPALDLLAGLGRLADAGDVGRLGDWLEAAGDWRARVNAARALVGLSQREEAVPEALLRALGDPSIHVAVEAARALSAAESLPLEIQKRVALKFMDRSLPWQVTAALAPALVRSDGEGVVMLKYTGIAGGSTQENPFERARLLEALGFDDERPAFLLLRYEARAVDPRIAAAAVAALGERWRRSVVGGEATPEAYYGIFADALRRRDLATASAAAPLLADSVFSPLGATHLLVETYRLMKAPIDMEPMVEILKALGASGATTARPLLDEALGHPHAVIRRAAAESIGSLTDGEPPLVPDVPDPPEQRVDWDLLRSLGPRPRLVLETERGRIVIALDAGEAPLTVATVARLAMEGRYEGVPFHRVVPNFVIQGGDFERGDGYGGPGFAIRSEFTRIPFERGTIGIASAGKDTEGSQYFITHSAQPHLDGRYTAFGRVVEGLDVVDRIAEADRVVRATIAPDRGH